MNPTRDGGPPERVVSLVPCITDTVITLGLGHRLVGVTRYCPAPDGRVAVLGGVHDLDFRLLAALAPDLVLADAEEQRPADLARLTAHYPTLVADVRHPADVAPWLEALGRALHAPVPAALVAAPHLPAPPLPCRTAVVLWPDPLILAGPDTYAGAVAAAVCGVLVAPGSGSPRYPRPTAAELAAAGPDLLVFPTDPHPFTASTAAAVAAGLGPVRPRTVVVSGPDLVWYGARTASGPARVAAAVHAALAAGAP